MATWPTGLPAYPLQSGYEESQSNRTIRTTMDVGPSKQRPRTRAGVRPFMLPLELSGAELEIFNAFYENTLSGGALAFDWVHPRTRVAVNFRFIGGQPPKWNALGGDLYGALLPVEVLP